MGALRAGALTGLMNQSSAQVIDGSLKFDKSKSQYLQRTPGSAGNRSVYTGSVWVKRTAFAPENNSNSNAFNYTIFSAGTNSANNIDNIKFYKNAGTDDANKIEYSSYTGSYQYLIYTDAKYRDPNGWYNVVWNYDGTTSRLYVNGEQITSFDTNTQNGGSSGHFNNNVSHVIGHSPDQLYDMEYNGYMSQFYWIDGLSLGPGYFGFTDPLTGTWRPKRFRAEGTTVNDGTVWSSFLTGARTDGTNEADDAFDGSLTTKAGTSGTGASAQLTFTSPKPIHYSSGVRVYVYWGSANDVTMRLDGGASITVPGNTWTYLDQGTGSFKTLTVNGVSNSAELSAIEVDGVIMQDSTTTNLDFGTNGFYLPMDGNSPIGQDKSGKGNNWTENNFSGTSINPDIVKDSPSGAVSGGRAQTGITTTSSAPANYCTLNPLFPNPNGNTLTDGNLKQTTTSGNGGYRATTLIPETGSWYWEVKKEGADSTGIIGIAEESVGPGSNVNGTGAYSWYIAGPRKQTSGVDASYGSSVGQGDIIGVAYNADIRELRFYLNGADQGVAFGPSTSPTISEGRYFPGFSAGSSSSTFSYSVNFGQKPFKYAPPQGYLPLNSASVRPETVLARPDQFVGVTTYTGTGSARSVITGVKADLILVKDRDNTRHWGLYDTIRGVNKVLYTSDTSISSNTVTDLESFNENGFSFISDDRGNGSGIGYVAYSWRAGGKEGTFNIDDVSYASAAAAGLDGGSVTPTAATIGTKQGFAIIKADPDQSAATISHGLGRKPAFIISKPLGSTLDWNIFHQSLGTSEFLRFTTAGDQTVSGYWGSAMTTTTFGVAAGNNGNNQDNPLYYVWADVPGLQKFGKYIGNNSADGPFIETGMRPAVVLFKKSSGDGDPWLIYDGARNKNNPASERLFVNNYEKESSSNVYAIDILSNGFKIRTSDTSWNASGATFVYAAWAEAPASNLFGGQSTAR